MPKRSRPGQPTKYKPEFAKQAKKLCELGATEQDLGEFFGVDRRSITNWKLTQAAFSDALKVGKSTADDAVERSLYNRAIGYSYPSQKIMQNAGAPVVVDYIEHAPPDTTACIFWLKNRRRDEWRDKHEIDHGATTELAEWLKESRERAKEG